jgi:hypothetical protein
MNEDDRNSEPPTHEELLKSWTKRNEGLGLSTEELKESLAEYMSVGAITAVWDEDKGEWDLRLDEIRTRQ